MSIHVNADNFARAETDRMFADIQREAGGVNTFRHNRTPAPIDAQTVIRLNRDTLYSFAIVDLAAGAKVVVPDAGERYLSVMIVDHDHYVRGVLHGAGEYEVTDYAPDSDYVLVAVRTLVDPDDAHDLSAVAAVQDDIRLEAGSAVPFESPEYDTASLDATRNALLALAAGLRSFERTFGSRDEVDPVRHLIGTAAGWGGLPVSEASYVGVDPQLPVGFYDLTMHDVPVDAFWSVSVYNAAGYFEPNEENRYTINSVTGARDEDGSVTVRFTPPGWATEPNSIPLPEGWNYLIRLYRPRPEFAEGSWRVPDLVRRRDREAEYAAAQPEAAEPGDTESDAAAPPATDNPGEGSAEGQADAPADEAAETPVKELTEVPEDELSEDELSEDELSEVGLETVAIEAVEDGSGAEAGASPEGLGDEQRSDERSGDPDAEASAR